MIDRMFLESNQLPEKPELGILLKGCVTDRALSHSIDTPLT